MHNLRLLLATKAPAVTPSPFNTFYAVALLPVCMA